MIADIQYRVRFNMKNSDGNWVQMSEVFDGRTRRSHGEVERMWRDKYRGQELALLSISYA